MAKVLITGANGFLGSWLTRRMVDEGHEVRILVRKTSQLDELEGLHYEKFYGDVTDLESLIKAVDKCDSVFHLAGVIAYSSSDRPKMDAVNIGGTHNVIQACKNRIPGRLVHLSSVVAIGACLKPESPMNEDSMFNLSQYNLGYFETKRIAEEKVRSAVLNKELDAVILNPSTIYGAGDALKGSRKNQIKVAKGQLTVYPPGGVSIVAVEDVIDGIISAWKKGRSGERYILSGENLLLKDVFDKIALIAGSKPPAIRLPKSLVLSLGLLDDFLKPFGLSGPIPYENAVAAVLYHWFRNEKATKELGIKFRPADYALEKSVIWMKENGILST